LIGVGKNPVYRFYRPNPGNIIARYQRTASFQSKYIKRTIIMSGVENGRWCDQNRINYFITSKTMIMGAIYSYSLNNIQIKDRSSRPFDFGTRVGWDFGVWFRFEQTSDKNQDKRRWKLSQILRITFSVELVSIIWTYFSNC